VLWRSDTREVTLNKMALEDVDTIVEKVAHLYIVCNFRTHEVRQAFDITEVITVLVDLGSRAVLVDNHTDFSSQIFVDSLRTYNITLYYNHPRNVMPAQRILNFAKSQKDKFDKPDSTK